MKILKTDLTGGHPIYIEDLGFIQDNVREITSAISKGLSFGNTAIKLYGAVVTLADAGLGSANYSVTAGAIWYNDEVYFVPQVNVIVAGLTQGTLDSNYYWNIVSTESEQVLFDDGLNKNVYLDKTMELSTNNTGILNSTTKTLEQALPSIQTATTEEMIAGTITDKYVNPSILGRQGESFTITYPGTVSGTTYQADRYVNGYRSSVFIDAVFTVGGISQKYVELVFPFPLITYGFVGGVFNLACIESKTGFWESYITLLGVMTNQGTTTTLRLSKPYNGNSLIADSSADPNPTFTTGANYRFTLNFNK